MDRREVEQDDIWSQVSNRGQKLIRAVVESDQLQPLQGRTLPAQPVRKGCAQHHHPAGSPQPSLRFRQIRPADAIAQLSERQVGDTADGIAPVHEALD